MEAKTDIVDGRPLFNVEGRPIRAAGVILYYREKETICFLFIVCNKEIEPFGGKTDMIDKDVKQTVVREAGEESNGIIKLNENDLHDSLYFPLSKYLLFFVESNTKFEPKLFGTKELHENINRLVEWMTYDQIIHQKMRKIDKKIFLTKIRFIIDPKREKLLLQDTSKVKPNHMLLSVIFNNVDTKLVIDCLESDLDVHIKTDGNNDNLMNLMYRESLNFWTDTVIPYKIRFLNENRGTIYSFKNGSYTCVCLPLEKFWHHDHPLAESINNNFDATGITVKHDGYIMKVFHHKNKWHVATNSESDAKNATLRNTSKNAREIFDECATCVKLDFSRLDTNVCYIFEMVHPECRLVVPYEKPMLYHLTSRDMTTLQEVDLDIGVPKPEKMSFKNEQEMVTYVSKLHFTKGEGLVLCDKKNFFNGRSYGRVKYKSPSYNREHKLLELTDENRDHVVSEYIVDYWLSQEVQLITKFHPELKEQLELFVGKLNKVYDEAKIYYKDHADKKDYFKQLPKDKLLSYLLIEMLKTPKTPKTNEEFSSEVLNEIVRQQKNRKFVNKPQLLKLFVAN